MKVAIVHVAHWDQLLGGAELQLSYLASHYTNQGDEVYVIYIERNGLLTSENGVILRPLRNKSILGVLGKSWFRHVSNVLSELKEIKPDLIITRTRSSLAGVCARFAATKGVKHQHFVASDVEVNTPFRLKSFYRVFDFIEWVFYSNVFRAGSELICQNQFQGDCIRARYKIQARVLTQLAPEPDQSSFDKPDRPFKVIWVANLKPLKRPEAFVALARKLSLRDDIEFLMIGADQSGSYSPMISATHDIKNFHYLGQLSNDEVNEVFCSSHLLVNTSEYEGFSNTFVQAWLREVVVVSVNSNPDNILTKEDIGFLSGSVNKTVKIVEGLASDRKLLKEMALRSRKYALENHTYRNMPL